MCGIIGIVGKERVATRILDGLRRLEYRGYDSAGIATIHQQSIHRRRAEGKLSALADVLYQEPLEGLTGIGHTRWATHGAPTTQNAHPHATKEVAVVHNGIIENFRPLKDELVAKGYTFESQTDTEVVPILITDFLKQGLAPQEAVGKALQRLEGAFALGIIFARDEKVMYAARKGSPLAIGRGEGEMYMGSDAIALSPFTNRLVYLEEGDWAKLTPDSLTIFDETGKEVTREETLSNISGASVGKENYRHFMEKEIHEQPKVIGDTLEVFYNPTQQQIMLPHLPVSLAEIEKVTLIACGTSFYATQVAKYWIEECGKLPAETDIASEFRYRAHALPKKGIAIFVSQSGETADTLAALKAAKAAGQYCIVVVNMPNSSMAREADLVLHTCAGPEIGVASTKAFTTQLTVLACIALAIGRDRKTLTDAAIAERMEALKEIPAKIALLLRDLEPYQQVAQLLSQARDLLYMGRGTSYPIAMEGALKLKEISYIHAEGYAAGEMKHGPIALIDDKVPVIVLLPHDQWFDKTISNLQEAKARGGIIVAISDKAGIAKTAQDAEELITVPECHPFVAPLLYSVPVQLLAYYTALAKGTDVDQPRNLAKSVTVE